MEKVADIFKEIRSRFSSPLFVSFIISWFVVNWRIPVALLFYKIDQLAKDGYYSYIDLIKKEATINHGLWYPLWGALAYTIFYPILKNLIRALNAWANTWGVDWSLNVAKKGKISAERYIGLRQIYHKQTKLLEEVFNSETDYIQKNADLVNERYELQTQLQNWKANYNQQYNFSQISNYDGEWEITYMDSGRYVTEHAVIGAGYINIVDGANKTKTICQIKMVAYSSQNGDFVFQFQQNKNNAIIGEMIQVFRYRAPDNRTLVSSGDNILIREMRLR